MTFYLIICESFNSVILEAREKLIVSMLEDIHIYLMERWDTNSKKVVAWEGSVLANIKKRLMLESRNTNNWLPRYCFGFLGCICMIF